jgi:hypothetical protein
VSTRQWKWTPRPDDQAGAPRLQPLIAAPGVAAGKEHGDSHRGRQALGHARVGNEDEGQHHRKGRQEHQQEHGDRASQIEPCHRYGRDGLRRLVDDPLAHAFQVRRLEGAGDGSDFVADQAMRQCRLGGMAHGMRESGLAAADHQIAQHVHHAIDKAPGNVAADGSDQHAAHLVAAAVQHAQRAGEGQHHEQAEQHLGDAVDRVERTRTVAVGHVVVEARVEATLAMTTCSILVCMDHIQPQGQNRARF